MMVAVPKRNMPFVGCAHADAVLPAPGAYGPLSTSGECGGWINRKCSPLIALRMRTHGMRAAMAAVLSNTSVFASDAVGYRQMTDDFVLRAMAGSGYYSMGKRWLTDTATGQDAAHDQVLAVLVSVNARDLSDLAADHTTPINVEESVRTDSDWGVVYKFLPDGTGRPTSGTVTLTYTVKDTLVECLPGVRLSEPIRSAAGVFTEEPYDASWREHSDEVRRWSNAFRYACLVTCGAPEQAALRVSLRYHMTPSQENGRQPLVCSERTGAGSACKRRATDWDRCCTHAPDDDAQLVLDREFLQTLQPLDGTFEVAPVRRDPEGIALCQHICVGAPTVVNSTPLSFCPGVAVAFEDEPAGPDAPAVFVFCRQHIARLKASSQMEVQKGSPRYMGIALAS